MSANGILCTLYILHAESEREVIFFKTNVKIEFFFSGKKHSLKQYLSSE